MAENDGGLVFRGGVAFTDELQERIVHDRRLDEFAVALDGEGKVPEANIPDRLSEAGMSATYVTFKNFDGTPVVGKNVVITLTEDGTDIHDITVEAL